MPGNMYTWLFQKYRSRVTGWSSEKELSRQLKSAYLGEADAILVATGQQDPPFDPLEGLRVQGVHDFRWIDGLPEEAKLIPDDRGFTLWLRKTEPNAKLQNKALSSRLRTTLAHELGHTLFYDTSKLPPRSSSSYMSSSGIHDSDFNEEWWCMDFARAYLMPTFWVSTQPRIATRMSLRAAFALKRQLGVSWEILFRRLIWDLRIWQNCIAFQVDKSALRPVGLWKSPECKTWSFKKWFAYEGLDTIQSVNLSDEWENDSDGIYKIPLNYEGDCHLQIMAPEGASFVTGLILSGDESWTGQLRLPVDAS